MKIRDGFIAQLLGVRGRCGRGLVRVLLAARLDARVRRNLASVARLLAGRSARAVVNVRRRVAVIWDDPDLRPLTQPVGAIYNDSIADLEPSGDLDPVAIGDARLNLLDGD
jgi:hypothetical protein